MTGQGRLRLPLWLIRSCPFSQRNPPVAAGGGGLGAAAGSENHSARTTRQQRQLGQFAGIKCVPVRPRLPVWHTLELAAVLQDGSASGTTKKNSLPSPGLLITPISPPCATTISRAIDSPNPTPDLFVPGTR